MYVCIYICIGLVRNSCRGTVPYCTSCATIHLSTKRKSNLSLYLVYVIGLVRNSCKKINSYTHRHTDREQHSRQRHTHTRTREEQHPKRTPPTSA